MKFTEVLNKTGINIQSYIDSLFSYPFEGFVPSDNNDPFRPLGISNKPRNEIRGIKTWKEYYSEAVIDHSNVVGYVREGYIVVTTHNPSLLLLCEAENWPCLVFGDERVNRYSFCFKDDTNIGSASHAICAGGFEVDYISYSRMGFELVKSEKTYMPIWVPEDLNTKNDVIGYLPSVLKPSGRKEANLNGKLALHDWILALAGKDFDVDELWVVLNQINTYFIDSPFMPEDLRSVVTRDEMKSVVKYSCRHSYVPKYHKPDEDEREYVIKTLDKTIKISYDLFSEYFFNEHELGYMKGEQGREGVRYQYDLATGIWKPLVGDELEKLIRATDTRLDPDQISKAAKIIKLDFEINPSVMQLSDKFDMEHIYLAFPNTTLEVSANGIKEVERRKEYMLTSIFPYDYHGDMEYQEGETVLDEIFSGDKTKELLFLQLGGVSMTRLQLKNMFYLTGDRDNGKSSLLNLWAESLAENQVSALSMNQLSDERYVCGLLGRTVNIDDDERDGVIKNPELFKKLVGSGYMSGKQLYKDPITFRNYATMVFACNDMPTVYNQNLQAKMVEIPFTAVFNKHTVTRERKLEVSRILASDEMHEYLLSSFVGALYLYMKDGRELVECEAVKEATEEYQDTTKSPIQKWLSIQGNESEVIDMHGVTEAYCMKVDPKQITAMFIAWYQDTYGMEPNIQDIKQALPAAKKRYGLKSSDNPVRGHDNRLYRPLIKK